MPGQVWRARESPGFRFENDFLDPAFHVLTSEISSTASIGKAGRQGLNDQVPRTRAAENQDGERDGASASNKSCAQADMGHGCGVCPVLGAKQRRGCFHPRLG